MLRSYGLPVTMSLILHGLILSLFLFSFGKQADIAKPGPEPEIVLATVMDETKIQAEIEKIHTQENEKRLQEENRQKRLEQRRLQEEKKLSDLRKKQQEAQARGREEAKKLEVAKAQEAKQLVELKKRQEEESKRLEELKKQQEETQKKRLEEEKKKVEAEKKRAKEEQRLAELEKKQKLEAERRKQKEIKRKQKQKELALKKQQEQKRKAEADRVRRRAIANAMLLIQQKVQRSWIRPSSVIRALSCKIRVKLVPGGEVIDAKVIRTSGNTAFDRSAESAVLKASPLPVPTHPELFSTFRTFSFDFKPRS